MPYSAVFSRRICWLPAVLVLLGLTACLPRPRGPAASDEIGAGLAAPPPPPPPAVPPEVAAALLPPLPGADRSVVEARFDVAANGAPVREFLLGLVAGTPYNVALHPEVGGTLTLNLRQVTVPEVLETLSTLYGYEFRRSGATFSVYPAGAQTRVFQVNYLNLVRGGHSQTLVSSGQAFARERNKGGNGEGSVESLTGSQIDTRSQADFWKELEGALRALVGSGGERMVVVQPQAGVAVVRAPPATLAEVESYLAAIDGNLQRQVVLEAKIVEVELRDGFQSGINWASLGRPGKKGDTVLLGQTGGGTFFSTGTSELGGVTGTLNPGAPVAVDGGLTSAFGGVFSAAVNMGDFNTFIELLETQGDTQVLSSPRIATLNNQKAVIKVGSDEFFVTEVSSTTVTGTTTTTTPDITLTPFFSGIALDVTPQISAGGRVTLHIHPTVSEVTDQNKLITVGGQTQNLPLALSSVREADSVVNAMSGQVVVIGGLMQTQNSRERAGVPFLDRIPFFGSLFRHNKSATRKSELVILLRPQVVEANGATAALPEQTRKRIEALQSGAASVWQGGLLPRAGE